MSPWSTPWERLCILIESAYCVTDELHELAPLAGIEQSFPQDKGVFCRAMSRCLMRPGIFGVRAISSLGRRYVLEGISQHCTPATQWSRSSGRSKPNALAIHLISLGGRSSSAFRKRTNPVWLFGGACPER